MLSFTPHELFFVKCTPGRFRTHELFRLVLETNRFSRLHTDVFFCTQGGIRTPDFSSTTRSCLEGNCGYLGIFCGKNRIRTCGAFRHTCFPSKRLKPLGHFTKSRAAHSHRAPTGSYLQRQDSNLFTPFEEVEGIEPPQPFGCTV